MTHQQRIQKLTSIEVDISKFDGTDEHGRICPIEDTIIQDRITVEDIEVYAKAHDVPVHVMTRALLLSTVLFDEFVYGLSAQRAI